MEKWEYKQTYIAIFPPAGRDVNEPVLPTSGKKDDKGKSELWQYLVEKELNKYGADGWELVSISESFAEGNSLDGYAIFKRKKECETICQK